MFKKYFSPKIHFALLACCAFFFLLKAALTHQCYKPQQLKIDRRHLI